MITQCDKRGAMTGVWIALAVVFLLAACGSDAEPEASPPSSPSATPDVVLDMASEGRPIYLNDDVFFFVDSMVDGESADVSFEADDDSVEFRTVVVGETVMFAGWTIHFESIFSTSLFYWAEGPNGEQIGGQPLEPSE